MQAFTDGEGRTWRLELTIGAAKRLKAELGLDLLKFTDGGEESALVRLTVDVEAIVATLYLLCEPQIGSLGLSEIEFAGLLSGDVFERAWHALRRELSDFFPKLGKGSFVTALAKTTEIWTKADAAAGEAIGRVDLDLIGRLTGSPSSTAGGPSTNSPASSA